MKTSAGHLSVVQEGGTPAKIPTESSWSFLGMVVWRRVRKPETIELTRKSFCCNLGNPHFYNLSESPGEWMDDGGLEWAKLWLTARGSPFSEVETADHMGHRQNQEVADV